MKVLDILNSVEAIKHIYTQELPFNLSYKVTKLAKTLNEVLDIFSSKREKILEEYTEQEAERKIKEILEEKVDIELPKLSLEELSDVKLSAAELDTILWLIDDA